ncbi:hypothetical protein P3X46_022709 [Hevea brasiliensis]|uniref:WRKY domain-containing protein n=1 Tax=Hevea brasiliensis TaxID=3981 RepID=A0ABQ9LAH5_HEVBR|nr:hypothetical protein P3X46_022709 [Hevea brasiliensis]
MAESESLKALQLQQNKRHSKEQNDSNLEVEGELEDEEGEEDIDDDDDDDDEEEEEEEKSQLSELQQLTDSQLVLSTSQVEDLRELKLETLVQAPSNAILSENDQCVGSQDNSPLETHVEAEFKRQDGVSHAKVLGSATTQGAGAQIQNELQSSICSTSLSELSPTSVTQPISSASGPTLPEPRLSPSKAYNASTQEADRQNSSDLKSLSAPIVKTRIPDAYNWRKYGQKQVKSPKGSRSYYRCTYSDCCAKKIECSDHSGHVIEIVNKGTHSHDPPQKNNYKRESKVALSSRPILSNSLMEHSISILKDSDQATLPKECMQETPMIPDKKRQSSSGSNWNGRIQIKEEHVCEPEPKRRVKKENLECSGTLLKPGKKPKFVVHAGADVGVSSDGYRWRKYGQKMVKGNPHPRCMFISSFIR